MVSLRRRKLLGFCTGVNENAPEDYTTPSSSNSVRPLPLYDLNISAEEEDDGPEEMDQTRLSGSNDSHDQNNQPNTFGSTLSTVVSCQPATESKPRKQHRRRKSSNNQEHYSLRGVYYKNKKWQAAIKVDKKQIHLGTVNSRMEAAHLYDKAAYLCGREPNFVLSDKEKDELRKLTWDQFMAITRSAITSKSIYEAKEGGGSLEMCNPPHFRILIGMVNKEQMVRRFRMV